MGTTVTGILTDTQIAELAQHRAAMSAAGQSDASSAAKFTFVAAFDGTNNDSANLSLANSPYQTNAANIFDQAQKAGLNAAYYRGVGTGGEMGGKIAAGVGPTGPITAAVKVAYADAVDAISSFLSNPNNTNASLADINIAVVGVSRGSPTAILFAQYINDRGLVKSDGTVLAPPGSVRIGSMALLEPVASFVDGDMRISPNVDSVLSVLAINEVRTDFRPLTFAGDARVTEVWTYGNHMGGVGGGEDKNGVAANVLEGVTGYFQNEGVGIGDVPADKRFDASTPPKLYTEIYQTAANGDILSDEYGNPRLVWRADDATKPRKTVQVAPGIELAPDGTETNLYSLTNATTVLASEWAIPDAASAGPSTVGNTLVSNPNYTVQADYSLLGDVNLARGNQALANYFMTDGLRPGNYNLGLNIGFSTGLSLQLPWLHATGNTNPLMGPVDYGLFGTGLNNASQANFDLSPADPLLLDLNGDGVKLTSYSDSPVLFDADHEGGSLEQTGWVSSADGIVVHDLNGDGRINHMGETLSEYYNGVAGTDGNAGTRPFANGFTALKSLDSNGDNRFDSADAAWSQLRVWVDADHDGITDASELKTFQALGITAIGLQSNSQSGEVRDGNEVLARGTFTQNGQSREAIAARFLANPAGSSIVESAGAIRVGTENDGGSGATMAHISTNTQAGASETLDAAALGVSNITGGAGGDTLYGDGQANWLVGGLGADRLFGGAGDDVLLVDADDIEIDGGEGLDVVQVVGGRLGERGVILNLSQSRIEIAVGGDGNDVFIGGGRSTVFVRGGAGDDLIVGGSANDVLSGEDGDDVIDGGAGNDLMRGHRGRDMLFGGEGDDVLDGGLEDDRLSGGTGNDVLVGGRGDDVLEGGDGIDVAQYAGSYADYRITKIQDAASGAATFRVVDTRSGQDGADMLIDIEKLSFSDVSSVDLTLAAPLPVKDVIAVDSSGAAMSRIAPHLIAKAQLLKNDQDWDSLVSELSITGVEDAKGGTAVLTAQGDVLFTADPAFTGVMSFKYKVHDTQGNVTEVVSPAGQVESLKATVYLHTSDLPADPLALEQWYLTDANVLAAWGTAQEQAAGQGYSGKGVRIGQFETGGPFNLTPEVFDYRHPDLSPNADRAWLNSLDTEGRSSVPEMFSHHATLVAGVMVAARNGEGGVGVAPGATLAGHYIHNQDVFDAELLGEAVSGAAAQYKHFHVVNNSWEFSYNFGVNAVPTGELAAGLFEAIGGGRGGLGTVIVFAGGNQRAEGSNTNYNALTANRAVITVGGINAPEDVGTLQLGVQPFSNPGASILVSAPGSHIGSTSRELVGDNGSTFGSQYGTSEGTSFAAPIVSGIVALMLEANPALGYRDVQTILAMTATKFDDPNGTDWVYNTGNHWNGGGMHTSHDYGFGMVDARAAVRLAETWYRTNTYANEYKRTSSSGQLNAAIPDGSGALLHKLSIDTGLQVETAQVTVELTHPRWGDLIIKLISPSGTESILVNRPGKPLGSGDGETGDIGAGPLNFSFNTTHVRGEASGGDWTLQVIDAATGLPANAGILQNWKLDLYGSEVGATDVYVYTNEFATTTGRTTLSDTNGGNDIINASAVTGNSTIDLNSGAASTLAGKQLVLDGNIERAFGGDGDDVLIGNADVNELYGERGNDSIRGGGGYDWIEGGYGNDTLTGGADDDLFAFSKDAGSIDTITDFDAVSGAEEMVLIGFDGLTDGSQLAFSQVGAHVHVGLGDGQTIVLSNTSLAHVSEQNFVFLSNPYSVHIFASFWSNPSFWLGSAGADNQLISSPYGDLRVIALGGDDVLGSSMSHDMIDGGNGNDTLWGDYPGYTPDPGADWIEGGAGDDVLFGGPEGDWLVGGSGHDALYGEDSDDFLIGNTGIDYLDGGPGNDVVTLDGDVGLIDGASIGNYGNRVGGAGSDTFQLLTHGGGVAGFAITDGLLSASNLIADFDAGPDGDKIDVIEFAWINSFADLMAQKLSINGDNYVQVSAQSESQHLHLMIRNVSSVDLTAEHFVFAPGLPGAIKGTVGDDALTGDAGANRIDGFAGSDVMSGRTGDDTYLVDAVGDVVIELPGGGHDLVLASVSYTLSDCVEDLELIGVSALNAAGNAERNRLVGNAGANRLDGGAEADELLGGAGNDTYVVDDQLDLVFERAGEGMDTVEASVSWTLGQHLENLILTGDDRINATGNELDNQLAGNAADNVLDGAQGADTMAGGMGNDTYYVDDLGDRVIEEQDAGIDTVYTSVDLVLSSHVENAVAFGAAISLTGNELNNHLLGSHLDNVLPGGGGDDVLDGGAGADTMIGGAGDDTYFVDNAGDTVHEDADGGIDTVVTHLDYVLGAHIENMVLTGRANLNGQGNALNNQIRGNSGDNTLTGGLGDDFLLGGMGSDTYIFNLGDGADVIDDTGGNHDILRLGAGLDAINIEVVRSNDDLLLRWVDNVTDSIRILNLFRGVQVDQAQLIERVQFADGTNWNAVQLLDALQPTNQAPVALQPLEDQTVLEGTALTYTIPTGAFIDEDPSDVLTYSAHLSDGTALPAWLSFDATTRTLSGTLPLGDAAVLAIRITATATDPAGASASSVFALHIEPDYASPVLSPTTHTLAEHYLNLILTGTAAINGTGNGEANQLVGNSAANVLSGGSGDDTYIYHLGGGSDTLIELGGEGHDTLRLGEGISPTPGSIRTSREGSDLILSFGAAGTSDQVRMPGYFDADRGTVETIAFANGKVWDFDDALYWTVFAETPATQVKYFFRRIGGDELDLTHPVLGLGQTSAPAIHIVNGTSGADTLHIGAGMRVDARMMGSGADTLYFTGRLDDYLQAIDQDSGIYTLAHRTRTTEVIQFTSMGHNDVLTFADGHIVFNANTDARLFDVNAETFLPILASYLLPGGTPVNAPEATLAIQGIAGTTLNATLSRPLATVLSDAQAQGSVAAGNPMLVYVIGVNGQDIAPLQRSGQAMTVRGGSGVDTVYVTPGTAIDARVLSMGADRIYFTGEFSDYTQTIDNNSGIYTFTHKTRPTEVVQLTSMGEDDELWFADGHIVFNAFTDTRLYDWDADIFMAVQADWLSPGGTPILTERLECSTDGGATWRDATNSVNGTTVTISDPTLSEGGTIHLRVASQTAQGAVTATQVTGDGDDVVLIGTAELASLAHSRYDGGAGRDTLELKNDQSGVLLDFAAYGHSAFTGIEQIDLTGGGNNTAKLTIDQLLHMPDVGEDRLIVLGDAGDSVQLVSGSGSWSSQGVQNWQGLDYAVYAHSGALERELFVKQGVLVV